MQEQDGALEWKSGPCQWSIGGYWLRDCEGACSSRDESGGILKESRKNSGVDPIGGSCVLPKVESGDTEKASYNASS